MIGWAHRRRRERAPVIPSGRTAARRFPGPWTHIGQIGEMTVMSQTDEFEPLDVSDLDQYMGKPLPVHQLREPVAVNDIRRWVQAMHYPNPLHYDPDYARESRFGRIVAPQSFVAATETAHGVWPANIGRIPGTHLIFGGDEWWFFGPRIYPGDHIKCYPMPFDYKVTNTKFAGPTCFQRGDTTYINQNGDRVALQRSTTIRYKVSNARKQAMFAEENDPEWSDEQLQKLEEMKAKFIDAMHKLGHGKRLYRDVEVGEKLVPNVLGPHSLASFTTEWRAFPFTIWFGAKREFWDGKIWEHVGYLPEMAGLEGNPEVEKINPELTDGAYYGPSRGHLQPRWAKHIGLGRGYGYGASMGAWILDYAAAWAGEWGFIVHSNAQYRNPAFTGDATFLNGEVTGKHIDEQGRHIATLAIKLENQNGLLMAKATVEVELPES